MKQRVVVQMLMIDQFLAAVEPASQPFQLRHF
jgi:hypothetical protein